MPDDPPTGSDAKAASPEAAKKPEGETAAAAVEKPKVSSEHIAGVAWCREYLAALHKHHVDKDSSNLTSSLKLRTTLGAQRPILFLFFFCSTFF